MSAEDPTNNLDKTELQTPRVGLKERAVTATQKLMNRLKGQKATARQSMEQISSPVDQEAKQSLPEEDLATNLLKDQKLTEPRFPISPDRLYHHLVIEAEENYQTEDSYKKLEAIVEQVQPITYDKTIEIRQFNTRDKLRHQALLAEARMRGLKDPEQFQELVEFFDSIQTKTESGKTKSFNEILSEERKNQLRQEWKSKDPGYHLDFSTNEGKTFFTPRRTVSVNVERTNISTLVRLANSSVNASDNIKLLYTKNLYLGSSLKYPENVDQVSDFLKLPNADRVIQIVKSIQDVALYGSYKDGQLINSITGLVTLAQDAEKIQALDGDTLSKINVLSKAMGRDVQIDDLDNYLDLIQDPLKFDLFVNLRSSQLLPGHMKEVPIFETIDELTRSGMAPDLIKLTKLGIRPNTDIVETYNFFSQTDEGSRLTISQRIESLRSEIESPLIQSLLSDAEKQAYIKVISQLNDGPLLKSDDLQRFEATYDIKERLLHLTLLLKQSESPNAFYYDQTQFQHLITLSEILIRQKPAISDVLTSPGFGEFLVKLEDELGCKPSSTDFYDSRYKYVGGDARHQYRDGSILVDLYNRQDLRDLVDKPQFMQTLKSIVPTGVNGFSELIPYLNFCILPQSADIVTFALDQKLITEHNLSGENIKQLHKLVDIQDISGKPINEFVSYAREMDLISRDKFDQKDFEIVEMLANIPAEKLLVFKTIFPQLSQYKDFFGPADVLQIIDRNIGQEQITWLMNATRIIPDFQSKEVMNYFRKFPSVLLSESGVHFVANITDKIQDKKQVEMVVSRVGAGFLSASKAELIVDQGKALFAPKMEGIAKLVLEQGRLLVMDASDVKFIVGLVGRFGAKAADVIRSYRDCLNAKVITHEDKPLVAEFVEQFRIPTPEIMTRYKESKQSGTEQLFVTELRGMASRVSGGGAITDAERAKPYFKDLLKCVYPNNVGNWTTYESNASCKDRSADLEEFKIRPNYQIDLLTVGDVSLKEGVSLDKPNIDRLVQNVVTVAKRFEGLGYDSAKMQSEVSSRIDSDLKKLSEAGMLKGISLDSLTSVDDKFCLLMTAATYGDTQISNPDLKDLMISYEFAYFEDVRNYIQGTTDRVSKAGNADYALLCELDSFYTDRVKEVSRRIIQAGWKNQNLADKMSDFFQDLVEETQNQRRTDTINRFQIDKLGMTEGFIKQLARQFKERTGRDYTPEQIKAILTRYESMAQGLVDPRQLDKDRVALLRQNGKKKTREEITQAIYGQLKSQRDKTISAANAISGEVLDPREIHLGEINLQQMLETQTDLVEGVYDAEQFAGFTGQRFMDLFIDERQLIEQEVGKFTSESGTERTVLNAYITKSKESANARMVGGVCVSGDNPSKNPDKNIWDMENYLQLVLQDPDSYQSQGLVLLHNFDENGKKVLSASFNPSSTYLYSVDEGALFNGLMGALEGFATDNDFDQIVVSQNKGIRTNRTGGQFERVMDQRISQVGESMSFGERQVFSYSPLYELKDMDVVWNKSVETTA